MFIPIELVLKIKYTNVYSFTPFSFTVVIPCLISVTFFCVSPGPEKNRDEKVYINLYHKWYFNSILFRSDFPFCLLVTIKRPINTVLWYSLSSSLQCKMCRKSEDKIPSCIMQSLNNLDLWCGKRNYRQEIPINTDHCCCLLDSIR